MKETNATPKNIKQCDQEHFSIEWNDGREDLYRLRDLQQCCPCAQCAMEKEKSATQVLTPSSRHVTAKRIRNVGRYALSIDFSSGCSKGIYSYDMLYHLFQ